MVGMLCVCVFPHHKKVQPAAEIYLEGLSEEKKVGFLLVCAEE